MMKHSIHIVQTGHRHACTFCSRAAALLRMSAALMPCGTLLLHCTAACAAACKSSQCAVHQ